MFSKAGVNGLRDRVLFFDQRQSDLFRTICLIVYFGDNYSDSGFKSQPINAAKAIARDSRFYHLNTNKVYNKASSIPYFMNTCHHRREQWHSYAFLLVCFFWWGGMLLVLCLHDRSLFHRAILTGFS